MFMSQDNTQHQTELMTTTIRPWKQEDLDNLVLYANNINVWNNLRNYFRILILKNTVWSGWRKWWMHLCPPSILPLKRMEKWWVELA